MSLGLSRIDGVFASVSDMQASKASNNRKLAVITAGDPITTQEYWTEAIDRGGVLLASGNYANPINAVGAGEVNTSSNEGVGAGLALPKVGTNLPFKSIVGGTNVTVTEQADTVTINASGGGGGATNLNYTASPTNGVVTSDTGTDATIPSADATNAGLLLPAEKTKLSNVGDGAQLVSVQAGTNVTVDNTDPQNPIISATGGGGGGDGRPLPYTISGSDFENFGFCRVNNAQVAIFIPVSLAAKPSSVTASGNVVAYTARGTSLGTVSVDLSTATYNATSSTKDMVRLSVTLGSSVGYVEFGYLAANNASFSITFNA